MLTRAVAIRIPGPPATKGSMKCIGPRKGDSSGRGGMHNIVNSHTTTGPWMKLVVQAVRDLWPDDQRAPEGQPLILTVTFTLPRPKEHCGTGRNAGLIKDRCLHAVPVGTKVGDLDKFVRAIGDGLEQGGAIFNDSQIVRLIADKAYVAQTREGDILPAPGVVVRLEPFPVPTPDQTLPDLEDVTP